MCFASRLPKGTPKTTIKTSQRSKNSGLIFKLEHEKLMFTDLTCSLQSKVINTELSGVVVHKAKVIWLFASGVVQISQRGVVVHRANVAWLFTELMWCGCSQG